MALKYYKAANKMRKSNPRDSYIADYNAMTDFGFDNAPNVVYDEIEYEQTYGKNDFKKINRVRVDTILNYNTGIILGDDYKTFIFAPEFPLKAYYGMKFRWKGSYWLVINTNSYATIANTAEVRRCNNVLRFFDKNGDKVYEPCIMDYTLRFANNEDTMNIIVGNGEQKIWCQRNINTMSIKANDRFLFGTPSQRVAFRVYGGGTKNYLNSITGDDLSPTLSEFYVDHYEINPALDDLKEGFANAYSKQTTIKISNTMNTIKLGDSMILNAVVYRNNKIIDNAEIEWESTNTDVLEIIDNTVVAKSLGCANISATISNTNITDSIKVDIVEKITEDVYELIVEPGIRYVFQGSSQKFTVDLYKNGIKQEVPVFFKDISIDVPKEKYVITLGKDNSFILENKGMFMDRPVVIECRGSGTDKAMELKIRLRGLY